MTVASGSTAVMARKRAVPADAPPWRALEFFPTPPWATRALTERLINLDGASVWEPCAGLGHMADVLRGAADSVRASDVFLYPVEGGDAGRYEIDAFDFLDERAVLRAPKVDWVITNPPFSQAPKMLEHALIAATKGVAMLLRIQWLEGETRFRSVFTDKGPTLIAPFVERVPMCEGGFDLEGSTATLYAWFLWMRYSQLGETDWQFRSPRALHVTLIPPCRAELTRPEDRILARRCVPGWIPPSKLKKSGARQAEMFA